MPSPSAITLRYAAFAAVATAVNLATQIMSTTLHAGRYELYAAMAAGTLTGLVTKYALDRRWIFDDRGNPRRGHPASFLLYSLTGVVTTAVFWGTELLFEMIGEGLIMRYAGAVLGLAIGYAAKYRLDRRFVFGGPAP